MPVHLRILSRIAPILLLALLVTVASPSTAAEASVANLLRERADELVAARSPADSPVLSAALPSRLPKLTTRPGAIAWTGSGGDPSTRPPSNFAGLIRRNFDPRDRATFLEPTRLFLESRYGSPPNQPESQSEELADEETPPAPGPSGTTAYPRPGGDLTGDGLEDILVLEFAASDNSGTMVGVRGTDGKELWRVEGPSFDWATTNIVGDLTGDDRDEILTVGNRFLEINENEECNESSCIYDYSDRLMVTVEVRSGATGEPLWQKAYDSTFRFHSEDSFTSDGASGSYDQEVRLRTSNLFVVPLVSGDQNGDGALDVVIDALDYDFDVEYHAEVTGVPSEELWLVGNESLDISDRFATRASIVSGDTGDRLALLAAPRAPALTFLEPGKDVTGDTAPELLWMTWSIPDWAVSCEWIGVISQCDESTTEPEFNLETLDGSTLESVWSKTLEKVFDAYVLQFDFDPSGDGIDDIVIFSIPTHFETFPILAVDGGNGSTIWTRETQEDQFPFIAGEFGGGPGTDLLAVTLRSVPSAEPLQDPFGEGEQLRFVLVRIDGGNGQTLFETTRPVHLPTGSYDFILPFLYAGTMPDADGDGQDDAYTGSLVLGLMEDPETGEWKIAGADSDYSFESGADGSVLAAKQGPGLFEPYPEPDLDGDGAADMSEWHRPLQEGEDYRVLLQTLGPATVLWERSMPEAQAWETTVWPSEDQDGVPGGEVVYGLNTEEEGHWNSVVASLTGSSGSVRWRK